MLLCEGETIRPIDLPDSIRSPQSGQAVMPERAADTAIASNFEKPLDVARREVIEIFERAYLTHHLKHCAGRVGDTAKRIGIEPRSLFAKMKRYGLRKEDFRSSAVVVGSSR
jgi:DNA-binding NtrC family response regulator